MTASAEPAVDLIALDDALNALTAFDARKGQVVEMRIFGGLSVVETAAVLQISNDTVTRDMHVATAWLRRELAGRAAIEPERWREIERVYHLAGEPAPHRSGANVRLG
jgi:DNA-directed RNA polymerase specialized sigma24 family protein